MKKLTFAALAIFLFAFLAMAQNQTAPGRGMGFGPYNASSETTVTGTIQAVQVHPGRRAGTGTHLLIKTKDATLDVHVGPTWYLEKQGISFKEGETVEVTGSLVQTKDAILAKSIKKGDSTVTLRDASGRPLWAGRGRRG